MRLYVLKIVCPYLLNVVPYAIDLCLDSCKALRVFKAWECFKPFLQ